MLRQGLELDQETPLGQVRLTKQVCIGDLTIPHVSDDLARLITHTYALDVLQCVSEHSSVPPSMSVNVLLQADMYSLGALFYQVLSYDQPAFPGINKPMAKAFGVATGRLRRINPGCIPSCLWELMEECWHLDPEKRIDLKDFYMRLVDIKAQAIQEIEHAREQQKRLQQQKELTFAASPAAGNAPAAYDAMSNSQPATAAHLMTMCQPISEAAMVPASTPMPSAWRQPAAAAAAISSCGKQAAVLAAAAPSCGGHSSSSLVPLNKAPAQLNMAAKPAATSDRNMLPPGAPAQSVNKDAVRQAAANLGAYRLQGNTNTMAQSLGHEGTSSRLSDLGAVSAATLGIRAVLPTSEAACQQHSVQSAVVQTVKVKEQQPPPGSHSTQYSFSTLVQIAPPQQLAPKPAADGLVGPVAEMVADDSNQESAAAIKQLILESLIASVGGNTAEINTVGSAGSADPSARKRRKSAIAADTHRQSWLHRA